MSSNSSLREVLNGGNPNEVFDATVRTNLGDLLSYLLAQIGTGVGYSSESPVTLAADVATLSNQPVAVFQVVAATVGAGGVLGVKKLRKGLITGPNALVPATGECVWNGGKNILFAAADAVLTADFLYATATDTASVTEAELVNS